MPNRLASESSPYLRQHADNPVDWWPWSDDALAAARAQNKPILLSIGYAACHWCHVMAHESFEDAATARVMNALYVNIKVDREERPDIDKVYQLAHQALTRRGGGWPLTLFLTADDLLPFYAGTYFPKSPGHGMPAFVQVLEGVRAWYDDKPAELRTQNASLATFLRDHGRGPVHAQALDDTPIGAALARIAAGFDTANGGHLGAPKFPHASELELLLANGPRSRPDRSQDQAADATHSFGSPRNPRPTPPTDQEENIAHLTLMRMAERGLRDHLGGGFFRYCVDAHWDIPHFEKMLYDNAQLLPLYAIAGVRFGRTGFVDAARDAAQWLVEEMSAAGGGFFSSLDADSDGEEGRYYVWQRDDVRSALDAAEYAVVERRFGLDRAPNFEDHAWHLREVAATDEVAAVLGIAPEIAVRRWQDARAKLLALRRSRVRPGLDDKILTAWNALTIAGVARALRAQPELHALREQAERALDVLHEMLWKDGHLFAVLAQGKARFPAYLDDHAFLLDALLAMLQLRWKLRDLDWAISLAEALLARFEDRERGGFFFTAHDAEALPQRPKPWLDESLPSGNGIAARALLRLGRLLGEPRYLDAAERTLRAAWPTLTELPHACCSLLLALGDLQRPPAHLLIRCRDEDAVSAWRAELARHANAAFDAWFIPADADPLPGALAASAAEGPVTAYLCRGTACDPPLTSLDGFAAALRAIG